MSEAPSPSWPTVTIKLATSLDGRIATSSGESQWITSEASRAEAHRLRASHDAVLVGSGTVLADDPELTARLDPPPAKQPLRIVADGRGRIPPWSKVFKTLDKGPVAIATRETTNLEAAGWPAHRGLQYWMLGADMVSQTMSLPGLLVAAARAGVTSIMVEGGGVIAASFVRAGLVSRIEWFRAPILLGDDGRPGLGDLKLENLSRAPMFQRVGVREVGVDLWESYVQKA